MSEIDELVAIASPMAIKKVGVLVEMLDDEPLQERREYALVDIEACVYNVATDLDITDRAVQEVAIDRVSMKVQRSFPKFLQ